MTDIYYAHEATIKELFRHEGVPFIPGLHKYYYRGVWIYNSPVVRVGELIRTTEEVKPYGIS